MHALRTFTASMISLVTCPRTDAAGNTDEAARGLVMTDQLSGNIVWHPATRHGETRRPAPRTE